MQQMIKWMLVFMVSSSSLGWAKIEITSINFKGMNDPSEILIQASGPISYEKQENTQDHQLIVEIPDASISQSNSKKIDTSSFNSKVSLVSPYQVPDQPDRVRVVVQLRESVPTQVIQDGNTLKITVPASGAVPEAASGAVPEAASGAASGAAPGAASGATSGATSEATSETKSGVSLLSSEGGSSLSHSEDESSNRSSESKSNIEIFSENEVTQKFTGKPITLEVRDADVTDVLRMIGGTSGFNTIIGSDVTGKITLSLIDVPWDQALDVILHTNHLGAERKNSILRIVTLKNLLAEKEEERKADEASKASAPRVTRVFPISYAKLTDLQAILSKFGTQSASSTSASSAGGSADSQVSNHQDAVVQADNRTNSLVIRDIPENLERMKKLIEILDTQTPQIMIEAKVVEVTEGFSKSLGGSLGVGGTGGSSFVASFAGGNPLDSLIGSPGVFQKGSDVSSASGASGSLNGAFGLSPSVSFIPGVSQLNALLNWGESENQVKIVSSPKTVVLNKEKASIVEGTPVLVPGTTTVAGVGTVPAATVQQANISLSVKPTVTNDGSVLLDLSVSKDVPIPLSGGQSGIGSRNLNTLVIVESGSTLVIGGIYSAESTHTSSGFPILRKLPILGALFGSDQDSTTRNELFIFVTPRILNIKEAGLSG